MKRQVQRGSREEAQIAESVLYGLLWQLLRVMGTVIAEEFNYRGADVHATGEEGTGVVYDGLTVHMASGAYEVTIRRVNA